MPDPQNKLPPGCKRCGRTLAYQGAEYCGAACSAQRRDGKTPEDFQCAEPQGTDETVEEVNEP